MRQNKNMLECLLTAAMLYLIRCKWSSENGTEQNQSSQRSDVSMMPTISKAARVPKKIHTKTLETAIAI